MNIENKDGKPPKDFLDRSLSGRLPQNSSTRFRWEHGATLNIAVDVGTLSVLPIEIIQGILEQLDLESLRDLQLVSTGMRRAITSLPKLRSVEACAPNAVRAIWATGIGSEITCVGMYAELCRPTCTSCELQPGIYLYLLACERVCRACLLGRPRYHPLRPKEVEEEYGLRAPEVRRLPRLRVPKYSPRAREFRSGSQGLQQTIHGWWQPVTLKIRQRNTTGWLLIDREVALRERLRLWYESGLIDRPTWERDSRREVADLRLPATDVTGAPSSPGPEEYPYSAAVLFPWLDRSTQNVGFPTLCQPCRVAATEAAPSGGAQPSLLTWYHCNTPAGTKDHIDRHGPIVGGEHVKAAVQQTEQ